jgi:hypothetical protein
VVLGHSLNTLDKVKCLLFQDTNPCTDEDSAAEESKEY